MQPVRGQTNTGPTVDRQFVAGSRSEPHTIVGYVRLVLVRGCVTSVRARSVLPTGTDVSKAGAEADPLGGPLGAATAGSFDIVA